jgi:hypothetical protein
MKLLVVLLAGNLLLPSGVGHVTVGSMSERYRGEPVGTLPPGWHSGLVVSGRRFFYHESEPGEISWELPPGPHGGPPPASEAEAALPPPTERLFVGGEVLATLDDGTREIVRVAREHDSFTLGERYSYTVTDVSGRHRRLQRGQLEAGMLRFVAPRDGAVVVAAAERASASIAVNVTNLYVEMGRSGQLCVELVWSPLQRRVPMSLVASSALAIVDPDEYVDEAASTVADACFNGPREELVLDDLPIGHLRLEGSWRPGDNNQPVARASVAFTIIGVDDSVVFPTYDWQVVEEWQSIPAGVQITDDGRRVRIPQRWTMTGHVEPEGEVQVEVGRGSTVGDIRAAALRLVSARRRCGQGHKPSVSLRLHGVVLANDSSPLDTIGLFASRDALSLESSCDESVRLGLLKNFFGKRLAADAMVETEAEPGHPLPLDAAIALAEAKLHQSLHRWASQGRHN